MKNTKKTTKNLNYCCLISYQLDLANQSQEVENSSQVDSFFTKLATDLLQFIKKERSLCILCQNFLTNLKDFAKQEKAKQKAKDLLTHQDLVEEMVNRVEKGTMPASEQFWLHLLYLYSKRDWEVCFGDERWGYKGFSIPDKLFSSRNKETALKELNQVKNEWEKCPFSKSYPNECQVETVKDITCPIKDGKTSNE